MIKCRSAHCECDEAARARCDGRLNKHLVGAQPKITVLEDPAEYTGKSVSYYTVPISSPTTKGNPPYLAECNDIIEALGMNYAEGNAFKALWRRAAQRTLGLTKKGAKPDGLYDAEKVSFFGDRLVVQSEIIKEKQNGER